MTNTDHTSSYSGEIAQHYTAYRPNLHLRILEKCFGSDKYSFGLDVGCGAGHSTIALKNFCDQVLGIDPSEDILRNVSTAPKISYQVFNGTKIPAVDDQFDIVTFAGSLYYAKSADLLAEIKRVIRTPGTIVVYDFDVDLKPIYDRIGQPPSEPYDHLVNLDDSGITNLIKEKEEKYSLTFKASAMQIAHLVLSTVPAIQFFSTTHGDDNLFVGLLRDLQCHFGRQGLLLKAEVYYSLYKLRSFPSMT